MKTKGQYRGHCQVCGRIQVVLPGSRIAKHGYTVPSGYFRGICQGSGELPLQVSRVVTDAIIQAMHNMAVRNQMHAEDLTAGRILPETAQQLTAWGSRMYQSIGGKQVAVMVNWHDATDAERAQQLKLEIGEAESNARFARGHAESLTKLATLVHGQPLIDRDAEELARVAERKAKKAPIAGAYRTKIEQKRDLEQLNREYSKLRQAILSHYMSSGTCTLDVDLASEMYYSVPHDLHQWREKISLLVLKVYPEMLDTVNKIRGLLVARDVIKSRPVIK